MSETSPGCDFWRGSGVGDDCDAKFRKERHLGASRSSMTRWSWLVALWTTFGVFAAVLFVVGEAGYGNRKLPKPFQLPPADPQLSARLPDLNHPASTLFDKSELDNALELDEFESTFLPIVPELQPSSIENEISNAESDDDVIVSTPLMRNRLLRLKRSPTGSAAGLKDEEELPSPVFVREEQDFPGLTVDEGDEAFLTQLFTSTVLKKPGGKDGEPTVATHIGDGGDDGLINDHMVIHPSSSMSSSSVNHNHHNPWEDVHQVGFPQPSGVAPHDVNLHPSSSVLTIDTPHPAAMLDETGSLAVVPTDFYPDDGSTHHGEILPELAALGDLATVATSSLVDETHHEDKAHAEGPRKSARRLDVGSASREQDVLMNVADKRSFKHPGSLDEDEFMFDEHHDQQANNKDVNDQQHLKEEHLLKNEDQKDEHLLKNEDQKDEHLLKNEDHVQGHGHGQQEDVHHDVHFHDFDSQALPAAPLIHTVIESSDAPTTASIPATASTTLKSSEWFNFDASLINTETQSHAGASQHGGTVGDEASFHVMDDGLDGQTTEDGDEGTLMDSGSTLRSTVKGEETTTARTTTTSTTKRSVEGQESAVNPFDLLDPDEPVEIVPLAVSQDVGDVSKRTNDDSKPSSSTTTTTTTARTTTTRKAKKKPLMSSDDAELEEEEEDLLEKIMEAVNGTSTTTQRTTRSTTPTASPTTTTTATAENASSVRDQKAHESGPGPPSAAESGSSTRAPSSLVIEGRRRGVEKFNQPATSSNGGARWRMTKGEILAVILGTSAAALVIIGSLGLVLYKRRLGLKFAFQFQRQALTDHSGSNNGSNHSPEDGNSGSSPIPPPHTTSTTSAATPNGVSFGLGQLSANLSRGLGLSSSSASASGSSRHRQQQNGSRAGHRPSRRATSFYAGVSRRLGGLASGVAAYASDGHSNHHIDLRQGNMDELNFQPAYMARNLESPRDAGMVDDFTNLDNDSFLNSLEFVNFAKINSQFGHTKL